MENQFNWDSFVYNINHNDIFVVIGKDLSMLRLEKDFLSHSANYNAYIQAGELKDEHLYINLYKYLAIRLWDIFSKDALPSPLTINNIVLKLQACDTKENVINKAIKNEIATLTDEQIVLQPFRNLVKISGFETFVTVNIDNFLERAFAAEGKHVNKSFNFSIPIQAIDPNTQKDPAIASIFNLMGNIEGYNFALTDEQSLEYVYMLQNGSDAMAKELFKSIYQKNILFVGSSFPDWFMRFFIRIISGERFKYSVKEKYVACDSTLQDRELLTFLENNATKVIPISNCEEGLNGNKVYKSSIEFIDEVYAQCDKTGLPKRNEKRYKEIIFISYSRDDKSLAERLRNEFERNGLHVFFDEDSLQTGDRYNQVIRKYIKDCDYFVALISENAIKDKTRYVYEKEWRSAIVLNNYKDQSYIRPFIIDKTAHTDARIPEEIRTLNIETIDNFNDLGGTVQKFIKENSLTPVI
jgi:TIR domain-containing protein/SIR2-like protein